MAQENQRFKFKVKFYGGNQTNHECSEKWLEREKWKC